jgi:integrase
MPKQLQKERIACVHFVWLLGRRDNDVYYADGRSNPQDLGRHSLGERDRAKAIEALRRLDLVKAVELGRASRSVLQQDPISLVKLEEGRKLYIEHVGRPQAIGGAAVAPTRYKAVFDKFLPFLNTKGVYHWNSVTQDTVEAYCGYLDDEDYAPRTIVLEATTIAQIMKFLVAKKLIPSDCLFSLSLDRPDESDTYCYRAEEVEAILDHCWKDKSLHWLGQVVLFLATTGLRISELVKMRWRDVDFDKNVLRLQDQRQAARRSARANARGTKSGRSRVLPLHPDLRAMLETLPRHRDGRILHACKGGGLDDDKLRKALVKHVLTPLSKDFPTPDSETGFIDGRLHSFRHFFVSTCVSSGVPEQVLMTWMGHRNSKMIRYYYHLHSEEAQKQIQRINPVGDATAAWRRHSPHNNEGSTPKQNGESTLE